MRLLIRGETGSDVAAIAALTLAAFRNAPHSDGSEAHIIDALRKAGALTLSLVAESAGVIVGHVAMSPVSVSDAASGWYGLGPISVLPERQGNGVGSALMREVLRLLRERGAAGCVLVGEPAYYGRFGFRADPNLVFPPVPPEYFQALSFGTRTPRGVVSYHEAFGVRA